MAETVNIGGITATIVSDEEAELSAFVVCGDAELPYPFTDNVQTTCCDCGRAIVHRPHAPKRPPKICIACVGLRAEGGHA